MNFQTTQNRILWRCRQAGVNWAGAPLNQPSSFTSSAYLPLLINEGYNDFLTQTVDARIATLIMQFTIANANTLAAMSINLRPIPANTSPVIVNPAALKVYEMAYIQAAGIANPGINNAIERYVPIISSERFRRWAGGYTRRVGNFSSYPQCASQQFGEPALQILPGFGVNGDLVQLTVCPDPQNSPTGCTAANGGVLANPTDVPLFPSQFHRALVEYACAEIFDAMNNDQGDKCRANYAKLVDDATNFGSAYGEGDPEQTVGDIMQYYYDPSMIV